MISGSELSLGESYIVLLHSCLLSPNSLNFNVLQQGYVETYSQSLISVVKLADEHFAASRRTSFLSSARSVMLGDYHNSVSTSSEAALWRSDTSWGPTQVV